MIEILVLIWLTGEIGKLAEKKGQKKGPWKLYTVLGWIGGEILGVVVSMAVFQTEGLLGSLPLAYGFAIGSYFIVRALLKKMPDVDTGFEFEQQPPVQ